jgi:hypothetical protein
MTTTTIDREDDLVNMLAEFVSQTKTDARLNDWSAIPPVQKAYRKLTRQFVESIPVPGEKDLGEGRGVVIPGGGTKYFPSLWVAVNRLREMGCTLPVEVWYIGESEMDEPMKELLRPFNVRFKDVEEIRKEHPVRLTGGWEMKPYFVLHSDFQEVLFMDADCAPTQDPTVLYSCLPYRDTGSIFWPDFPHWTVPARVYDIFDVPRPRKVQVVKDDSLTFGKPIDISLGYDPPVESGQMLINKAVCWRELNLAKFYCDHSDYYFKFVHGDKEAFHLAWRRFNTPYGMPLTWPDWDTHTAFQFDFTGRLIFTHRTQAKWTLDKNRKSSGRVFGEDESFDLIEKLKAKWDGTIWRNKNPNEDEKELTKKLENTRWIYHRVGHDARILELLPDGMVGEGDQIYEQTWSVFSRDGRKRLVIGDALSPTCFLFPVEGPIEQWTGRWCIHEKMTVSLIRTDIPVE